MATLQTSLSLSPHQDLITSLAFSSSSSALLATSSLDHSIRITSQNPQTGAWDCNPQEWKAHDAAVLKVAWASPEFGTLLASGGVDGVVKIWAQEEVRQIPARGGVAARAINASSSNSAPAGQAPANPATTKRFQLRHTLTDARGTLRDLEFSPSHFGLKLAAVSSDSHLRVWECLDPISLNEWSLVEDVDLSVLGTAPSGSLAGAGGLPLPGGGSPSMASASFADSAGSPSKGGAPLPGGGMTAAGMAMGSLGAASSSAGSVSSFEGRKGGTVESDGGWALSWCKEHWWGERLAVSSGSSGIIRLFHLTPHAPWSNYLNLLPPRSSHSSSFSHTPATSSLSWSPASGRSYQLVASGSRDGRARVWKLHPPSLDSFPAGEGEGVEGEWKSTMDAELEESKSSRGGSVGGVRVEWNVTGTVLSTAGDDARVRLWKSTYTGQWRPVAVLSTEDEDGAGGQEK